MATDLNKLLDKLEKEADSDSKFFDLRIDEARSGDHESVAAMAKERHKYGVTAEDLESSKELFQWLVEQGESVYEAYVSDIDHLLNTELGYSELEVKKFLSWCENGDSFLFGMVVKSIQSDSSLFTQFRDQAMKIYKKLSKKLDEDELDVLDCWHSVLILDPRSSSSAKQRKDAMKQLESTIAVEMDTCLMEKFLDEVMRQRQQPGAEYDTEHAMGCLDMAASQTRYAFYNGLDALTRADYARAYQSFCEGSDKRCRLSQAYCLINGLGTTTDREAARSILRDYPEDGFALYLLAVSLFRDTKTGDSLPPEVTELLEESARLGYKPAKSTALLMPLLRGMPIWQTYYMNDISLLAMKQLDSEALGFVCFYLYLNALSLQNILRNKQCDESQCEQREKEFKECLTLIKQEVLASPLGAYARALTNMFIRHDYSAEDLMKPLRFINQSARVRKWGLAMALTNALITDEFVEEEDALLDFLQKMGASDREVAIWCGALSVRRLHHVPDLYRSAREGFADLLQPIERDNLKKLMVALFSKLYDYEDADEDEDECNNIGALQQLLTETNDVTDPILAVLRNRIIREARLGSIFEPSKGPDVCDPTKQSFAEEFIGYDFFDYTV